MPIDEIHDRSTIQIQAKAITRGKHMMNSPMSNPGQVKSFPSEDELVQLQRRLTFHPSTVTDPKVLAQAQVAAYNCEGYIKPITIFNQAEITDIRSFFDEILARTLKAGRNSYSIVSAHMKYGRVYDLLTDPRMVAVVKDILGDSAPIFGGSASHRYR